MIRKTSWEVIPFSAKELYFDMVVQRLEKECEISENDKKAIFFQVREIIQNRLKFLKQKNIIGLSIFLKIKLLTGTILGYENRNRTCKMMQIGYRNLKIHYHELLKGIYITSNHMTKENIKVLAFQGKGVVDYDDAFFSLLFMMKEKKISFNSRKNLSSVLEEDKLQVYHEKILQLSKNYK